METNIVSETKNQIQNGCKMGPSNQFLLEMLWWLMEITHDSTVLIFKQP